MGKKASKGTQIWVDHYNWSGSLNSAELAIKQTAAKVDTFDDDGPRRVVDGYDHSTTHNGFFNSDDDSMDEILFDMLEEDDSHYIAQVFGSKLEGATVYESIEKISGEPRQVSIGQAILTNFTADGSGQLSRGLLLRTATATATGDGTGFNQGATTLGQVYVALFRVFGGTFTHFTAKLQHSNDNGGTDAWADIATLTSGDMTVPGVVRVSTTAATKAWKRVVIETLTGTSVEFAVTGTVEATA